MLDKIKKTIADAGDVIKEQATNMTDVIKEQASNVSDSIKEKTYLLIEDWLTIFPALEGHGLKIMSFGLSVGLSPALDVELRGKPTAFTVESLAKLIEENKGNQPLTTVFRAIKTTYEWHAKTGAKGSFNSILLKLSVKITPEVKVYLGTPLLT